MRETLFQFSTAFQHGILSVGIAALALIGGTIFLYAYGKAVLKVIRAYCRYGLVEKLLLTPFFVVLLVYGSTKKTEVYDLEIESSPDSVIVTWSENASTTVNAVSIQRRIKGAIEDEAWETLATVPGGVKCVEIEGFTLDRDFEYRALYTYTE